jgi:hypothetical protein
LFAVLLLIINPSLKKENVEIIKPNLIVAVDNSSSINYKGESENVLKFVQKIKSNNVLNSKYNIAYYSFGNELKNLDSLDFKAPFTNLFEPINALSKVYNTTISPLVLITDGNQTNGNDVAFLNYKSPVYPYIVGDTTTIEDIYIKQLNVNETTFINNQFPVEVFIDYNGNSTVNKVLSVFHKGKKIYSETIQFSKAKNLKITSFFLKSESEGMQYYTVQIENLTNEQNTLNNSKEFSINVIKDQSNILLLTAVLHPDIGMFKRAIEHSKQRTVTISKITDNNINITNYELVILYQPNNKFKFIFDEINNKKINYFIVTGLNTDWNFLNSTQNIFSKKAINAVESHHAVYNNSYTSFSNSAISFSSFAPLEDRFGSITFKVPYQTLLFQKIGNITTEEPLLATFEINNQKAAVLFGENSWRWRMNSFTNNQSFEIYDAFISNLMQYLAVSFKNSRLNVTANAMYYANETIQISANYLDENLNVNTKSTLWLSISNKEINYINKIPFAIENNLFLAELSNLPSGEYHYTVTVENQPDVFNGIFKVLPFEVEQQFATSADDDLNKLALKTGGKVFYNSQEELLINSLINDERNKSTLKSTISKTPLIDWKWLLGIIICCLSIEWFLRKYSGLI